eukprot:gene7439-11762_t
MQTEPIEQNAVKKEIRHLEGITVRNLESKQLLSTYFTLDTENENLYKSYSMEQTNNPCWTQFDITEISSETFQKEHFFIIKLYNSNDDCEILTETFDFHSLHLFSKTLKNEKIDKNSIFLEFSDGYYVSNLSKQTSKKPKILPKYTSMSNPIEIDHREIQMNTVQLVGLQYAIEETKENLDKKKEDIEKAMKNELELVTVRQSIETRLKKIKLLKEELEAKKKICEEKKEKIEKFNKKIEEKIGELLNSENELLTQTEFLTQNFNLKKYENELIEIEKKLGQRRTVIIEEIFAIYQIQKTETSFTISNIVISSKDNTINADDSAASGLGYIAHIVRLLSKLYQIPLRYPVFPLSSRSFVRDEMNIDKPLLPLFYTKGQDKNKYIRAVSLLNLNICHMLRVKGCIENSSDILQNLLEFKNLQK